MIQRCRIVIKRVKRRLSDLWRIVRREVGLSGRPLPLSSRVREGGVPSPEEFGILIY